MAVRYSETRNGEEAGHTSITYDEYGHRKTMDKYDDHGNSEDSYKYSYQYDTKFNVWTQKYVERKERWDDTYTPYEKEEREISTDGYLARRVIYGLVWDDNKGDYVFGVKEDVKYDYAHICTDDYGNKVRGHVVECTSGDTYEKYQWFEPARDYIQTERSYMGTVDFTTTFGTNSYTQTYYSDYGNGIQKRSERTYYFNDGVPMGQVYAQYNSYDGSVSYSGEYLQRENNTPSAGWTTQTTYNVDPTTGQFFPISKFEIKGNAGDGQHRYDYEKISYSYYNDKWEKNHTESGQNLGHGLYKSTYGEYVSYYKLDDENKVIGTVSMNDDGSYVVKMYSDVSYAYYDASHHLLREVKHGNSTITVGGHEVSYQRFYIKSGGQWVPMDQYEESISQGSTVQRTVYLFNDDGTPTYINIYQKSPSINNEEETLVRQTKYIYEDNGYKVETWSAYKSGGDIKMGISEEKSYYLLADGTYQYTHIEYEDHTVIGSGSREEEKDGIVKFYSYDRGQWVLYRTDCNALTYVTDDGVQVRIDRYMNSDNVIINTNKIETKNIVLDNGVMYQMEASYSWDDAAGAWRGNDKSERKQVDIPFAYQTSDDPLNYDDEYLTATPLDHPINETINLRTVIQYVWDDATNDWRCRSSEDFDFAMPDENTLTYSHINQEPERKETKTIILKRDAQHKLISRSAITETTYIMDEQERSNKYETTETYTYNRYGYMDTHTVVNKNNDGEPNTTIYKYEYEDASILVPTDVDRIVTDKIDIRVLGRAVTVNNGVEITLYDLSGRSVVSGHGTVVAPAAGIYIVRTQQTNIKLLVK